MKEQHTIYKHPLFDAMVVKYQEANHISSWSSATIELLIRGIEQWLSTTEADIHWPNEEELREEHREWQDAVYKDHGWKERTILDEVDSDKTAFYRFVAEQVIPKHGGKRPGQGRPKGSKNKKNVQPDPELDEIPEF